MVFTFLVTVVACAPLSTVDVTLLRSEHNELEVRVEWGDEGMRMQIEAKPNRLLIQSSANGGETIFYIEKQESLGTFISALGQSFFTMEMVQSDGVMITTDYMIPTWMTDQAKKAFKQGKIDRMVSLFGREDVQSSTENVIRELTHRPEVRVLEETAHTLGERGVTGRNNRGALLFYTMVLQLVRGREGNITLHDRINLMNVERRLGKRIVEEPEPTEPTEPPVPTTSLVPTVLPVPTTSLVPTVLPVPTTSLVPTVSPT